MSLDDPDAPASALTCFLLPHIADPHIAARRRAHYELLLDALADLVPPPYTELPPGASPLMFPIESENKPALIERFRRGGVEAADLWPAPHPRLTTERFPRAATRRARGIGLPVHQEASPDQLERVARIAVRRPSVSSGLRLEPLTTLDALGEEWDELAIASRNVFATREWLSVWREHRLRGEPVLATACRTPGGRLVAILPLYVTAEYGVRVLRFLGYGPSDQLGPICAPSDRLATARALRRFLADCPERWDLLIGHHLPSDQEWDALVGARLVGHQASPVIRFGGGSWDDFLASLSSNFRKEIRKDARRLAREHQVRYRLADNAERLSRDLDTLFELHGAQWRERSGFTRWERFHRAFAATALARGWLRFWLLEVDGVPVAAKYNFRFGDVEFSYQSARDVSWKRVSLGLLVRIHAMRAAFEEGVREYRLLRGGERHKYRFPTEDAGVDTIALARDPLRATALTLGDNLRTAPALAPARRWIGRRLRSG